MEFKETIHEHAPQYNEIEFKGKWVTMTVSSADLGGDVEINISESGYDDQYVFLNQENIKQLITHLQKQLK